MGTATKSPAATPMMAQYLALKRQVPDALLMFRMGDFYELFLDDAVTAAAALDIALTHRGEHLGQQLPMCGVPVHSHEAYLARLVRAGHAVAIAEQVESPADARKRGSKALVRREIVRVVTAGTLTEERLLERGRSNWLAAAFRGADAGGLAWCDISTGAFWIADVAASRLGDEVARIAPAELLVLDSDDQFPGATALPQSAFDSRAAERALLQRFAVATLDGFGGFGRAGLAAAGAVLAHLEQTARGGTYRLDPPRKLAPDGLLAMDAATRRSLELTGPGSLLDYIDLCVTGAGSRLLAEEIRGPLTCRDTIERRLDLVQWFGSDGTVRDDLRQRLREAPDLQRALGRIASRRGSPRDLGAVRDGLAAAAAIGRLLARASEGGAPSALEPIRTALLPANALCPKLTAALVDTPPAAGSEGGVIREGHDTALDELRLLARDTRVAIAALESGLRQQTGLGGLKVRHNNVIGFHVEIASRFGDQLLADPTFQHRQTLAGVMRFDTEALRTLATRIAQAQAHALAAEAAHMEEMLAEVLADGPAIAAIADALARLDRSAALAALAVSRNWCRPAMRDDAAFHVVAGRHPVVEAARVTAGAAFVPNDCRLQDPARVWLVTGPNMGGKSTFLRQNALIAILAQAGSFVPAAAAEIGIVDALFSRVGASDSLAEGRSTFMVEMVETAAILTGATSRSLLLLDEVGRGTATWDGLALAWAVLEAIHDRIGARCLFASHYHELTVLADRLDSLALRTMKVREWQDDLVFLHEVGEGAAPGSFGLQVARLAGVPSHVLHRAGEILERLERSQAGGQARDALGHLPLFGAVASQPAAKVRANPLRERLQATHPDSLSPRAALDLLYELKALAEEAE